MCKGVSVYGCDNHGMCLCVCIYGGELIVLLDISSSF